MKHLVFDTETTQLISNSLQPISKQPRVIEFFGLKLNNDLKEESVLHCLFNPGIPITEEITKITGIKSEDVKNAPSFALRSKEMVEYFSDSDAVVAHNFSFDKQVLDFEFERSGLKLNWPKRKVCTVESTEHLKGFRLNLVALHQELFNEPFAGAHRAENDVRALARCYIELINRREI